MPPKMIREEESIAHAVCPAKAQPGYGMKESPATVGAWPCNRRSHTLQHKEPWPCNRRRPARSSLLAGMLLLYSCHPAASPPPPYLSYLSYFGGRFSLNGVACVHAHICICMDMPRALDGVMLPLVFDDLEDVRAVDVVVVREQPKVHLRLRDGHGRWRRRWRRTDRWVGDTRGQGRGRPE